jgi:hypothetical protein
MSSYTDYIDGWHIYVTRLKNSVGNDIFIIDVYENDGVPGHKVSKIDIRKAVEIWAERIHEAIGLENYLRGVFNI